MPQPTLPSMSVPAGVIKTNLQRHMGWSAAVLNLLGGPFMKTVPQGAATTIYAATAREPLLFLCPLIACCLTAPPATPNKAAAKHAAAVWHNTSGRCCCWGLPMR